MISVDEARALLKTAQEEERHKKKNKVTEAIQNTERRRSVQQTNQER